MDSLSRENVGIEIAGLNSFVSTDDLMLEKLLIWSDLNIFQENTAPYKGAKIYP